MIGVKLGLKTKQDQAKTTHFNISPIYINTLNQNTTQIILKSKKTL